MMPPSYYRHTEPRYNRPTSPSVDDQAKLNSLYSQLARAKARRDHHLVRQLEAQVRRLTNTGE